MCALYELLIGTPKPAPDPTHPAVRRVLHVGLSDREWKDEPDSEREKRLAYGRKYQKTYYVTHKAQILARKKRFRAAAGK